MIHVCKFTTPARRPGLPPLHRLVLALVAVAFLAPVATRFATAQQTPLYDREPYDVIVLNEQNNNVEIRVLPIPFPGRRLPAKPNPRDKVRYREVDDTMTEYEVAWKDIARIELFEVMLRERARTLARARRFDESYDFIRALLRRYPQTDGLDDLRNEFLFRNAGDYFQQKRYSEALGILEELYDRKNDYRFGTTTVLSVVDRVAGEIVNQYMTKDDIESAQKMLSRMGAKFGEEKLTSVVKWRQQLSDMAAVKRDEARAHMNAGRLRQAHAAVRRMLEIWPQVDGGKQLANEVETRYPLVVVGVSDLATRHVPGQIDNWAARRTGRLRHREFLELTGPGPEGGEYVCPMGKVAQSEDRRQLTIELTPSRSRGVTGFEISERLMRMATPGNAEYDPTWGGLMGQLSVDNVYRVEVGLQRPYVLPETHLQVFLNPKTLEVKENQPSNGPYVVARRDATSVQFLRNRDYAYGTDNQPADITEQYFEDPQEAVSALTRGLVDVLDRVSPAQVEQLKQHPTVKVGRYALPTVHVLVPNYKNPFLASATFRRALAYGIYRDVILDQIILGGQQIEGCEVVSGPFPKGVGANDPLGYAYDISIEPRKYNPRLAATLVRIAEYELKELAKLRGEKPPKLEPLVIGHPNNFLAKLACEAIVKQLDAIGVKCRQQALPPGASRDPTGKMDLVYTELAVWEPIRDARRILATTGLAGTDNMYVDLACRHLDNGSNWKDVARRLHQLHFIAHNEAIVLPLWQIADHFAYNPRIQRIGQNPASLYHDIERWHVAPRSE